MISGMPKFSNLLTGIILLQFLLCGESCFILVKKVTSTGKTEKIMKVLPIRLSNCFCKASAVTLDVLFPDTSVRIN